jgi:hypothetical protein
MPSQPSERAGVVGRIDPQTVANTQLYTDVIDMSKWREVMGIALLGNMASETIDFKAYTCDNDGSNATALVSATQLAASASANDNKQIVINLRSEHVTNTKRYVKFGLVTGGATGGPACVVAIGLRPVFGPATDDDLSSVVEVKS